MLENINTELKLQKLQLGEISVLDNLNFYIKNIEENNSKLKIVLNYDVKSASLRAKTLDELPLEQKNELKLFGLVFLIKSNILKKGFITNCSSHTLENYKATYNSDVVELLEKEGAIILGTVDCDEFACGALGKHSAFGFPINVNSPNRVPGGSCSGSACCISANFCDISLGSDTGGSIRAPASHCNIVGLKPSYGRVSRYGLIDMAMSFDQIGPMARDVFACEKTMQIIAKASVNDSTTIDKKYKSPNFDKNTKYKIGIIKNLVSLIASKNIKEIFENTINQLKTQGHKIIEVEIDKIELGVSAYYPIVYTEFFSGTRKFDGLKYGKKIEDSAGEEVNRRILGGREISKAEFKSEHYKKALKVKEILSEGFDKAFKKCDFIINPVTSVLPPKRDETLSIKEEYNIDMFTTPSNLAGICCGVVPRATIKDRGDDVNIGLQIMANKFCEDLVFEGMYLLEELDK